MNLKGGELFNKFYRIVFINVVMGVEKLPKIMSHCICPLLLEGKFRFILAGKNSVAFVLAGRKTVPAVPRGAVALWHYES